MLPVVAAKLKGCGIEYIVEYNEDIFLRREVRARTQNHKEWASLVAQSLGIRLPMWGTWVRALVREGPTCHGVAKPMCHNY